MKSTNQTLLPFSSWPETSSPAGYYPVKLDEDASSFYKENGYLVIEDALSRDNVAALNNEAVQICRGERGAFPGLLKIPADADDDQVISEYLCIHFPHKISSFLHDAFAYPQVVDVLKRLIGPDVKGVQSMFFVKRSGKPGQAWHQDEYHIPTRDRSLTGCWMALDDATVENGCLWVIPGSHRPGVIWPAERQEDPRFDCGKETKFPYSEDDAVPVEVKAGSIVFFNGYLLHRSLPNYAKSGYRRALVNHYMSASSMLPWLKPDDDRPLSAVDTRDIVMVAGEDPYDWKGTEDVMQPHVRSSGEGGCGDARQNTKEHLVRTTE